MSNILVNVEGWTYHWMDNETMTWSETREKNLKEKSSSPYYWIGMRKINGTWTWVANGQSVNYENWAPDEPNNNQSDENCVELYISRINNNGKWNNDSCKNPKHPVCHKTQCPNKCTDRQDCEEQVNNFTCVCKPGFSGPDHFFLSPVLSCEPLSAPPHGWMECSGLYGNHSLNSNCTFSCAGGYKLNGTAELKCNCSGSSFPLMCASEELMCASEELALFSCVSQILSIMRAACNNSR
uniref:Selectin P n=1 Tax=Sinocyclocheilus anshuiensis TaxID=1608454 RepID=A0A671P560_9TELE